MRKLFLYGLVLCCVFNVNAWAFPSLKTIPEGHVLKVSFTQHRFLTDIPKPIVSNGELLLWNGKGLIWRTIDPFPSAILITKKGLYQVEDGKKISMMKAGQMGHEGVIFEMLTKLLSGSFPELKEFKMINLPSTHGTWKISLIPTLPSLQDFLSSIEVEGNQFITRIIIHRSNNDRDEILLKNHIIMGSQGRDKVLTLEEKKWLDD